MEYDWRSFAVDTTTVVILMAAGILLLHESGIESSVSALLIVLFTRYYRWN